MKREESNLKIKYKTYETSDHGYDKADSAVNDEIYKNKVFRNINKSIDSLNTIIVNFNKKNDTKSNNKTQTSPLLKWMNIGKSTKNEKKLLREEYYH